MDYPAEEPGKIENAVFPSNPVEGVDYVYDDVMQADGSVKRTMIRRLQP
jgi:hypothetical protein